MAGEAGHMLAEPGGRACGCGNQGCVETVASVTGMLRSASEAAAEVKIPPPGTGEDLSMWITDPNPMKQRIAQFAVARAGHALGIAFSQATILLDLRHFVLGGGGSAMFAALSHPIRAAMQSHIYGRPISAIELAPAILGNEAGVLGAAIVAA
jgi:glucokinase